jgi:hypothetical protein
MTDEAKIETLKARIQSLERLVRELEGRARIEQRNATISHTVLKEMSREIPKLWEVVYELDKRLKEHDAHIHLLMTQKSNQLTVNDVFDS